MTWTADLIAQLDHLVRNTKCSKAQIAHKLGISKNAVIGRIYRNPDLQAAFLAARGQSAPKPASPRRRKKDRVRPGTSARPDRNSGCRYPLWGSPSDDNFLQFCEAPITRAGSSYCEEHHVRCWVKPVRQNRSVEA